MSKSIVVENLSKSFVLSHQTRSASKPAFGSLFSRLNSRLSRQASQEQEIFWALRDVGFEVEEGERLAIVGRNGAGKSTLLKILSRVMAPTTGTVKIRGRLSSLLEVGTGFHPELTGRENIYLNGAILGMRNAEVRRKFDAIVDFAEIERFLDTPVKHYSSGMYVRLAFAVSAFLEPDIVVLDEVLSVGDANFQKKSYAKMQELAADGRTVLFVSHSMGAVKELCESAIVLDKGIASEKTKVERAVGTYLRSMVNVEGVALPLLTEEIHLLGISIMQKGESTETYTLDGGEPIDISLLFQVNREMDAFRMGFYVKAITGEMISRSLMADWDSAKEHIMPGTYRLNATIPANFLVAGDYVLEIHSSIFGVKDFFASDASQSFRIAQSKGYNSQHLREQPFGFVHLNPAWRLEQVSA